MSQVIAESDITPLVDIADFYKRVLPAYAAGVHRGNSRPRPASRAASFRPGQESSGTSATGAGIAGVRCGEVHRLHGSVNGLPRHGHPRKGAPPEMF